MGFPAPAVFAISKNGLGRLVDTLEEKIVEYLTKNELLAQAKIHADYAEGPGAAVFSALIDRLQKEVDALRRGIGLV